MESSIPLPDEHSRSDNGNPRGNRRQDTQRTSPPPFALRLHAPVALDAGKSLIVDLKPHRIANRVLERIIGSRIFGIADHIIFAAQNRNRSLLRCAVSPSGYTYARFPR